MEGTGHLVRIQAEEWLRDIATVAKELTLEVEGEAEIQDVIPRQRIAFLGFEKLEGSASENASTRDQQGLDLEQAYRLGGEATAQRAEEFAQSPLVGFRRDAAEILDADGHQPAPGAFGLD